MIEKSLICLCLSVCLSLPISGQEFSPYVDSLIAVLDTIPEDTSKVHHLNDLASSVRQYELSRAVEYSEQALSLSDKLDFSSGIMESSYFLGFLYRRQGEPTKALEYAYQSLELAEELSDSKMIANNYNSLGNTYQMQGTLDKAIEAFLAALEGYAQTNDQLRIGNTNNNIGIVFKNQQKFDRAIEYYQRALAAYDKAPEEHQSDATWGRANAYMNMGNAERNDSIALIYLQKSLDLNTGQNNKFGIASCNINIGSKYIRLDAHQEALPYYEKGLKMATNVGSKSRILIANTAIAGIYNHLGQYSKAIPYAKAGLEMAKKTEFLEEEGDAELTLANIYKNLGEYELAVEHYQNHIVANDSLFNVEQIQRSNELEAKYQGQKTEAELAASQLEAEREKNLRNTILLAAAGLLIIGLLIAQWFFAKHRKKQQVTQVALALKEQETQQLKELDHLKTSFFTNISHELRTPLTLILSPLEDILEDKKAQPVHDKLKVVQSNARNLHNLVNEIMDLSKVEAGKLELEESQVAILPTIKRIFSSFESMAELRRLDFTFDCQLEDIDVKMDRDKFEKIINNLLANAIKFSGAGQQVSMKARKEDGMYLFEITDTGQGIHPDDLPHIFDRFYQAKKGLDMQQGGTGVGLALSKELTQLLGGNLSAVSTLGKGSTFSLKLPLNKIEVSSSKTTSSQDIADTSASIDPTWTPIVIQGQKPKILIVEDNPEMGAYLLQILSEHYQCTLATDGLQALQKLHNQSFDCITSDVMMPNMDGFELRQRINQDQQWKQLPFLLLTARHLEEDKLRGFQLGIDDYVTKPFSTKELKARIHNLIQNKIERDQFRSTEDKLPVEEQLSADEAWIKQVEQEVLNNIDNPQFGVEDLGKAVGYSSKQLGRLIKKQTGYSTVNFVLEIRLQKARDLMERRLVPTVTAAQLEVGISSMSYFTRKFTERFGKNPKEVLR